MRVFAAVVPPPSVVAEIETWLHPLRAAAPAELRWAAPPTWHCTLAFYGEVAPSSVAELAARLARATARRDPAWVRLAGAGSFEGADRGSVLWLGVAPGSERGDGLVRLRRLAEGARAAGMHAGLPAISGRTRFRAHCTIGRARAGTSLDEVVGHLAAWSSSPWSVDRVVLLESRLGAGPGGGPSYQTVAVCPTRASGAGRGAALPVPPSAP